jgi:hypothetical protein
MVPSALGSRALVESPGLFLSAEPAAVPARSWCRTGPLTPMPPRRSPLGRPGGTIVAARRRLGTPPRRQSARTRVSIRLKSPSSPLCCTRVSITLRYIVETPQPAGWNARAGGWHQHQGQRRRRWAARSLARSLCPASGERDSVQRVGVQMHTSAAEPEVQAAYTDPAIWALARLATGRHPDRRALPTVGTSATPN